MKKAPVLAIIAVIIAATVVGLLSVSGSDKTESLPGQTQHALKECDKIEYAGSVSEDDKEIFYVECSNGTRFKFPVADRAMNPNAMTD